MYDCIDWDDLKEQHEDVGDFVGDDSRWDDTAEEIDDNWIPSGNLVLTGLAVSCFCVLLCIVAMWLSVAKKGIQIVVAAFGFITGVLMLAAVGLTASSDLLDEDEDILLPGFEVESSEASYGFAVLVVGWILSWVACVFAMFPCNVEAASSPQTNNRVETNTNL